MQENACELFTKSFLQKMLIHWECRHFEKKYDDLVTLLAVSIYFDRVIFPEEIEAAKNILKKYLHYEHDIECAIQNLSFKLESYTKNNLEFLQDRERAFDIIVKNIQSYGDMKEIFEADGALNDVEKSIEDIIKKEYDKRWDLKKGYGVASRDEKWKN